MATNLGKEEDAEVELELCLSLGGPFKKVEKAQPLEFCTDSKANAVRCVEDVDVDLNGGTEKHEINARRRKEWETKEQLRSGGEGECKRIRTECKIKQVTNGVEFGNGYGSGQYKENSKAATIGSPICSSSDVSNPSSSSPQKGGSCELGISSGKTKPVDSPVNNILTGTDKTVRKPPKPRPNGNDSILPFAQMPCVTSTGNGPEGKTVNGFLYRYSKSEVSIICVCHGTSFSPAEFIIHAGGTHVSHPLRHITVVPSKF